MHSNTDDLARPNSSIKLSVGNTIELKDEAENVLATITGDRVAFLDTNENEGTEEGSPFIIECEWCALGWSLAGPACVHGFGRVRRVEPFVGSRAVIAKARRLCTYGAVANRGAG